MKDMNIIMCSSKEFSLAACVVMQSVMDNNSNYRIRFFLATLSEIDAVEDMKKMVEGRGHEFQLIMVDKAFFEQFKTQNKWTSSVYLKLMMHEYLPQEIDRVLYIDIDIICNGSLEEFYETKWNDEFIAVCANSVSYETIMKYNQMTIKDEVTAANGGYFNSGIVLFNLSKIRSEITTEMIIDAYNNCQEKATRFLADQSILNYLYCEKSRYLNPMDYNYRIALSMNSQNKAEVKKSHKCAIIHYVSQNQPYKPWDLWLTDEEVEQINGMPFEWGYIYITDETNRLINIWWDYAKKTPVYDDLYKRMLIKKEWFMVYGVTVVNMITRELNKNKKFQRRCGYIDEERSYITRLQSQNKLTFLEAVNQYWGNEYDVEALLPNKFKTETDIFSYLDALNESGEEFVVFISVYHTAVGHWEEFLNRQNIGLTKKIRHCEGYCAIVDMKMSTVTEKSGKDLQKIDYFVGEEANIDISHNRNGRVHIELGGGKEKCITCISKGFDLINNTVRSQILVNNIDYCMGNRGINIVVYSVKRDMVVDSIHVDVHGDETFHINRTI